MDDVRYGADHFAAMLRAATPWCEGADKAPPPPPPPEAQHLTRAPRVKRGPQQRDLPYESLKGATFPITLDDGQEMLIEDLVRACRVLQRRGRTNRNFEHMLNMRVAGATFAEIGAAAGISSARANQHMRVIWHCASKSPIIR
jgi:hypothetical protein